MHADLSVLGDGDRQLSPRHRHHDAAVDETSPMAGCGDGAARRSGRERVTSAALPDENAYLRSRHDLRELNVGALRKGCVLFDLRSKRVNVYVREIRDDDDAVRISHRDRGHLNAPAIHLDRVERIEARRAHVHRHLRDAALLVPEDAAHATARRVKTEAVPFGIPVVAEELREDARAVAALLGLAAVRVEDADAEIRAARGRHEEDSVRADATMAVADEADGLRRDL